MPDNIAINNKNEIRNFVERKGIKVLYESLTPGMRGSTFQKKETWYIIINKTDTPERQNFTLAHEYCEILLHDEPEMTLDEKHHRANQMASELLLPEESFGTAVHENGLHELKQMFPHVSYEVIARRIPFFLPVVVSIFDNGVCTCRFGSENVNFPKTVSPGEMQAMLQCYENRETTEIDAPPIHVTGYHLEETNCIKRVILIADIDERTD